MANNQAAKDQLTLLTTIYGGLIVLAAVLSNKQLAIGPFASDAGQITYAGVLAILALVTQTYGQTSARKLIRSGFVLLAVVAGLMFMATALPASPLMEAERSQAFHLMVGQGPRIIAAGMITYFTVTNINVWLLTFFSKTKVKPTVAAVISNLISQFVDTLLFVTLAFAGVFPLMELIIGQMIVKGVLGLTLVPTLVGLGRRWLGGENGAEYSS